MVSEILMFQINVIKLLKILKYDGNLRFHRILLQFDKTSNQKYIKLHDKNLSLCNTIKQKFVNLMHI